MIVKELTFTRGRDERPELERLIADCTTSIATYRHNLTLLAADAVQIANVQEHVHSLADHVTLAAASDALPSMSSSMFGTIFNAIRGSANDWRVWANNLATELARNQASATNYITRYEARLTEARMRLARARPVRTYTLRSGDFRKDMAHAVNGKNTRLHCNKYGRQKTIETVFDDIVITPSLRDGRLPPWIKVLNGLAPCVRIPPVKAVINLDSHEVMAKCVKNGTTPLSALGYICGFAGFYSAHPHVTSRNGALCLGDWGGALMEALDTGDMILAFDVLKQFLRSANGADPAGAHWARYLSDTAYYHWNLDSAPLVKETDDGVRLHEYYLLDGKGGVRRYQHTDPNNWPDIQINDLAAPPPVIVVELPETEDMPDAEDDDLAPAGSRDEDGYDEDGYDEHGYNRDGYDRDGYDYEGYDCDGYDREGFSAEGYDRDGYYVDGYDFDGWDRDGFDRDGYDGDGYNRDGYNRDCYDRDGRYRWAQEEIAEAAI